ncbi:MAG: hypothetical protein J1E39_03985 [Eubacterium sp.]|nr:hypothetical protein [Eubacterium sp.]
MSGKAPDLLYPKNYRKQRETVLPQAAVQNLKLEYIAGALCPHHTEYALKILSQLNTDPAVISYRQDVLEDFINVPELEGVLFKSLHIIYNNAKSVYARVGSTQSFFEINENLEHLGAFIECMEICHGFYEKCYDRLKSEGVRGVATALEDKYNSDDYKDTVKEVAELKRVMGNGIKSATFGINFDELMRPSEVALLSVGTEQFREKGLFERLFSKENVVEPVSNIYARKTKDGALSDINQRLFAEIDALSGDYLRHFNTSMKSYFDTNIDFLLKLEPQINFYIGAANLISRMRQMKLPVCRPMIKDRDSRTFTVKDMYDIAFANKMYRDVYGSGRVSANITVNDCVLDDSARILILTGPNNGGKTTFTRAAGINLVLAQCGLCVAGSSAEISPADNVFVHFPKEEEMGVNASRFTEECKEFADTVKQADDSCMVLMNESLSSTTPGENLVIAEELMKIFADMGVRLIYTTHIREIAMKKDEINSEEPASRMDSIVAECDENGHPTYRIVRKMPDDRRNARDIFDRFGISYREYLKNKKK